MPANEIVYDFDLEEDLVKAIAETLEKGTETHRAAVRAVFKILDVVQEQTQARTPVNDGHLRGSFGLSILLGSPVGVVEGQMTTPLVYGIVMEMGRTPGERPPPPEPIELWILRKQLTDESGATYQAGSKEIRAAAYVIARSIGRDGIIGKFMVRKGVRAARPAANQIWDALLEEIIRILANE